MKRQESHVFGVDVGRAAPQERRQRLGLEHPLRPQAAVGLLDEPSWEQDDGEHVDVATGAFGEQSLEPRGLGACLDDGLRARFAADRVQPFAIKLDGRPASCGLAPGLRFDRIDARGSDQHVVDIEARTDDIVEDLVAILAEPLEELPDGPLAFGSLAQRLQAWLEPPESPSRHSDRHSRCRRE